MPLLARLNCKAYQNNDSIQDSYCNIGLTHPTDELIIVLMPAECYCKSSLCTSETSQTLRDLGYFCSFGFLEFLE